MNHTPKARATSSKLNRRQRRTLATRAGRSAGAAASTGAALALGLGLHASDAHAAPFEVTNLNDSGAGSLRQAISDANTEPGPDTIAFQAGLSGTITLTSGQFAITDSVEIAGPGAAGLTIDADDASRIFYLNHGAADLAITISGLKLTKGFASPTGGAIFDNNEDLTLDGVELTDNVANSGGAIHAFGADLNLTIRNSLISGNSTVSNGDGGGLHLGIVGQPVVIESTRISNNAAGDGAGMLIEQLSAGLTLDRSTISGNTSTGQGAALYIRRTRTAGALTISSSTISGNTTTGTSALYLYSIRRPVVIENSTISGNTSGRYSALYCYDCNTLPVVIRHTTIAGNVGTNGSGGLLIRGSGNFLSHTIVADNTGGSRDINANMIADHCLVENPMFTGFTSANGNLLSVDPMLGPLQDNGGPTRTQLPAAASMTIDAGDPTFMGTPSADQRGFARVFGGALDIGAVERNPGTLQSTLASISLDEDDGSATITVTRTGGREGAVSLSYATADATAQTPADYTSANGMLQWSDGDAMSKTFQVNVADDNASESGETFTAALASPTDGAMLGATANTTVTITDDDAAPTIGSVADQSVMTDHATAAIAFTVADTDDGSSGLTLTAASSNPALVPDANVVFGGTGSSRDVTVTPASGSTGATDITLTVSDGTNTASEVFTLTVNTPAGGSGAGGESGSAGGAGEGGTSASDDDAGTAGEAAGAGAGRAGADAGGAGQGGAGAGAAGSEMAGEGGEGGSGGSPSADAGVEAGPDAGMLLDESSDCGCNVPGARSTPPKQLMGGMLGLVAVLAARRRKRR